MRGFFSSDQQQVLLGQHGQPDYEAVEHFDAPTRYVPVTHVATVAHAYAGATPDEIVVVTSISEHGDDLLFDDKIDLGPVGNVLHSWRAGTAYPTRPMILPADRLDALVANRIGEAEAREAYERAIERAEASVAAPAP